MSEVYEGDVPDHVEMHHNGVQPSLMSDDAPIEIITVESIGDDERVSHIVVAVALGMSRNMVMRQLVERNIVEFQRYGEVLHSKCKTLPQGGRPGKVYWLNEGQCLLAAIRSDAPRAPEVRYQIITAFMEYRRRKLAQQAAQQAPMVHVREHERRPSTKMDNAISLARSADRLEAVAARLAPQPQSLAAILIDGVPMVVDMHSTAFQPSERALVIGWDGRFVVQCVEMRAEGFGGQRGAWGQPVRTRNGEEREACVVVGKIIEAPRPEPTAALPQPVARLVAEPHAKPRPAGRLPVYRDDVLRLTAEGKSKREIAVALGCNEATVVYWRRRSRA